MARAAFDTILVAIEDPSQSRQAGLKRAVQLGRRGGARLHLFHSEFFPFAVDDKLLPSKRKPNVERVLSERRQALERLAAPLRRQGLKISVTAAWDYPAYEAIVREVMRTRPDLVVAESRRQGRGARFLLTNTDWQLIRLCPAPLLFVKQPNAWGKARVLAALDPLHAHAKPARLDHRILEVGQALATLHGGKLDAVHAYIPPYYYVPGAFGVPTPLPTDAETDRQYARHVQRTLERTVAPFELQPKELHLQIGMPSSVLPGLARRLRADVVVMGAVSRSGLKRLFVGSTAERTIDALTCDVLVVKPRGFKTPVPRRFRPAQLALPPI